MPITSIQSARSRMTWKGALPAQKCSGHVLDGIFEDEDIRALHSIAKKGMSSRGRTRGRQF